jgi:hypothetical protein
MKQSLRVRLCVILLAGALAAGCNSASKLNSPAPQIDKPLFKIDTQEDAACPTARQIEVSRLLEEAKAADQAERTGRGTGFTEENDLERRKQVALMFAEGCITTGADYFNAALIYQHGTTADHFYQTYLWSRQAEALGNQGAKGLTPMAIDRYLMRRGFKQIFASQMVNDGYYKKGGDATGVWCVWPNIPITQDGPFLAYSANPMSVQIERVTRMNKGTGGQSCPIDAPDPPKGLFPGIW